MEKADVFEKVLSEFEKLDGELVESTQELVRIPSLTGREGDAQAFMETRYRELGLELETFTAVEDDIAQHPAYVNIPGDYENRPNVVGILKGSEESPSLILNGHVDVVSPEPIDQWTYDPWGAEVKDGRIYGRGSADMKSGLIANYIALKAILNSGIKPKGNVLLESVIEEEAGGSGGTLACFVKGFTASGMLITEPSDLQVVVCHPGIKYFRVRVVGKTAHAALSHTGVNAIGKMNKIYDALIALDKKRAAEHHFHLIEQNRGRSCNLNIGTYSAGNWASTVAGMATMECRVGYIPGEQGDQVMKEVEKTISDVAEADPWLREKPPTVEWYGWDTDPWVQDDRDSLIQAFLKSSSGVLDRTPEIVGMTGGLDTRFGPYFSTPSFSFGVSGAGYHGPDEYVKIDSIKTLARVVAKFVLDYCGYE
ncbi:ArgE/DapE family deacylase [Thermodesulfobacteriota bacterium]